MYGLALSSSMIKERTFVPIKACISEDKVTVTPEIFNLFLERFWKMNHNTELAFGVALGPFGFVKSILDSCFKIILFDFCRDITGIEREKSPLNFFEID